MSHRPSMTLGHALHVAALRLWRRFPWPGGRGRYWAKRRLLEGRRHLGPRPIPTEVGWLWLEWGEDRLQQTLYASGHHYEDQVTVWLEGLDLEGRTVLDVGAHVGFYALLLARRVGSGGQLVAFEPQPGLSAAVERALDAAGAGAWTRVLRQAAGDQDGSLTLRVSEDSGRTTAGRLPDGEASVIDVPMVRLDTWLDRWLDRGLEADLDRGLETGLDRGLETGLELLNEPPALIKIDVEGAEWLALQGLEKTLASDSPPMLVVEVHPRQIEDLGGCQRKMIENLERFGYRLWLLDDKKGPCPLERPLPKISTWHLVAIKPEGTLGGRHRALDEAI